MTRPPRSTFQRADRRRCRRPATLAGRRRRRAVRAAVQPISCSGAQEVHRAHHARNAVQLSTLISIKTGGCPEDCGYCPQAARYHTGVANDAMLDVDDVVAAARAAKDAGATRFCMGAAWRGPKQRDLEPVLANGARSEGAGPGNLRDARHAEGRAGRATARRRPRLLQPQSRHRAGVLRRDRLDARVPGSARHARPRARRRACTSAAAASSAWARSRRSAPG